jgi:hypothetical protein
MDLGNWRSNKGCRWESGIRLMGIGQDITDSILQQDKLQLNLKEKETLLKEIHHRVKNNLQIISSLLNLQSSVIDDEKVKGHCTMRAKIESALWQPFTRCFTNQTILLK